LRTRRFFERILENWPAKIISLAVALVLFLFYRIVNLEERFFNVPLSIEVPENFTVSGNYPRSVRITLRGREEEIFHILEEDIVASADLSGYANEGEYKVPVEIEKKNTALREESIEVTVEPSEVAVALDRTMKKSLDVLPSVSGYPANGYELSQYFITPSTVELKGPASIVGELERVLTEEINVDGKTETFTVRIPLDLDEEVSVISGEKVVEFHGIIQERVILKTFEDVDLITLDLEPEFTIENIVKSGSIQVQGTQNHLLDTEPGQLRLVVDCSDVRSPGTYTLAVKPDVPLGLLVLNYRPQNVTYIISREEEAEE
jgi:YbbR domain-containing protein